MKMPRNETIRLSALGVLVLLEGLALVSAILHISLLPLPESAYAPVVSVAVFVLPSAVGLLSRRLEAALLLAAVPFWALGAVYLTLRAPIWELGLVQLGILIERAASATILLGILSLLGWLLRRVIPGTRTG
jgi:hypothetical protein